ncbi:MAG: hypothetical protein LM590_15000, partial [Thermofilum sp.]|nr:hypothetical protein [Thermofilum sp.]
MSAYDKVHPLFLSQVMEPRLRTFIHIKELPKIAFPIEGGEEKRQDLLEALGLKPSVVEKAEVVPLRVFPELGLFSAWVKPKEFLDLLKEALAQLIAFVE